MPVFEDRVFHYPCLERYDATSWRSTNTGCAATHACVDGHLREVTRRHASCFISLP